MDSDRDTRCRVGCPIRISTDQSLLAAPHGFSQRATSFIASWCQGIHRMPFLYSRSRTLPQGPHHAQKPSSGSVADGRHPLSETTCGCPGGRAPGSIRWWWISSSLRTPGTCPEAYTHNPRVRPCLAADPNTWIVLAPLNPHRQLKGRHLTDSSPGQTCSRTTDQPSGAGSQPSVQRLSTETPQHRP
jgi:hypothetical protein